METPYQQIRWAFILHIPLFLTFVTRLLFSLRFMRKSLLPKFSLYGSIDLPVSYTVYGKGPRGGDPIMDRICHTETVVNREKQTRHYFFVNMSFLCVSKLGRLKVKGHMHFLPWRLNLFCRRIFNILCYAFFNGVFLFLTGSILWVHCNRAGSIDHFILLGLITTHWQSDRVRFTDDDDF